MCNPIKVLLNVGRSSNNYEDSKIMNHMDRELTTTHIETFGWSGFGNSKPYFQIVLAGEIPVSVCMRQLRRHEDSQVEVSITIYAFWYIGNLTRFET